MFLPRIALPLHPAGVNVHVNALMPVTYPTSCRYKIPTNHSYIMYMASSSSKADLQTASDDNFYFV